MGYTRNAIEGFSFQTFLKIATAVVAIAKWAVIARVLTPETIGLFSLVTISLGVTEATTQTGVNLTIVRSKQSVKYFLDSAWVIAIIRGLVIGVVMILLGFVLSKFFDQPELLILVCLTALVPVIKGFINPSIIELQKELKFFHDASFRLVVTLSEAAFSIAVALLTKSIFALIGAMVFAALVEVVISFILFKDRPRFVYQKSRAEEILHGAKWLSFSALFDYLNENLDNFLIGKLTGVRNLGLYHNAYAFAHRVNYDQAKSVTHGTLPIYSKLQNNPSRLMRAFMKATLTTMVFVTAVSVPLLLFPEFFVNLLLGEQWLEISGFLHWLVLAGIIQSFSALCYSLMMAKKAYSMVNLHLASSVFLMAILVFFMSKSGGLSGAAFAIFISRLVNVPILIWQIIQIKNENR